MEVVGRFMWPWLYCYLTMVNQVIVWIHHGYQIDHGQPEEIRAWSSMVWFMTMVNHGHQGGKSMVTMVDHRVKHIQPWLNHGYQWWAMVTMVNHGCILTGVISILNKFKLVRFVLNTYLWFSFLISIWLIHCSQRGNSLE